MNREAKKVLNKINALKSEALALIESDKIEEAESKYAEIEKLQKKFDLITKIDDGEPAGDPTPIIEDNDDEPKNFTKKEVVSAFVNSVRSRLTNGKVGKMSVRDKEVVEMLAAAEEHAGMNEGTPADGGLTVPQDIQTDIRELRRTADDLETLVNVESVTTKSGSRVIEKNADTTPWDDVDEDGEFPDAATPQFVDVKYEIKKKGGILKVTYELLKDSAQNIMNYLNKYIAKKSRATRNAAILKALDTASTGKEVVVTGLDSFKDIFNVQLDPAISVGAVVVTNQNGFNFLDKLKDADGNYILQKDPTDKTKRILFGAYPVIPLSNKALKDKETKVPFYIGDLKEAVTLFDREKITIDINENVYWKNDKTGIKIRDRFDVKIVDEEAFVKGELDTATPAKAAAK